jgi:hypothetical protein
MFLKVNVRRQPMTKTLVSFTLVNVLAFGSVVLADEEGQPRKATHMKVSGVVSKVETGLTTVKTPWGTMRIASQITPKDLEVGEEVEMQVNENNTVIDIHRKGDRAHAHRFVTGDLAYTSADKKGFQFWTAGGGETVD